MSQRSIYLIRHGQSTFNAAYENGGPDPLLFDARLSPLGHRQVASARETLAAQRFDLVVTSPLTRAIQTTLGIFAAPSALLGSTPIRVEALPSERMASNCDVGRPPPALAREFPTLGFDHLPEVWWPCAGALDPVGVTPESDSEFTERLLRFRAWLEALPEQRIAVVGHGVFFWHLAGVHLANCEVHLWDQFEENHAEGNHAEGNHAEGTTLRGTTLRRITLGGTTLGGTTLRETLLRRLGLRQH